MTENLSRPRYHGPPLTTQARTLARAVHRTTRHALTGGQIVAAHTERDRRMAICEACEHLSGGRCLQCGCWLWAKVRLGTEQCPLGKWEGAS